MFVTARYSETARDRIIVLGEASEKDRTNLGLSRFELMGSREMCQWSDFMSLRRPKMELDDELRADNRQAEG